MDNLDFDKIFKALLIILIYLIYLFIFKETISDFFRGIYLIGIVISLFILFKGKFSQLVSLYLFFLPMGPILPTGSILIEGVELIELISLLLIVQYFLIYKRLDLRNLTKNQKLAISLMFFFFVIYQPTFYTKVFFEYNTTINFTKLIIRITKNIIHFLCLTMIITKLKIPTVKLAVKKSLLFIIIFYSVSVFFSPFFQKIGLQINYIENRFVGLFNGNSNMYGHFLSIAFGYLILKYEKEKKIMYLFLSLLPFVAILITASRTGLLTTILIFNYYLFRNINVRKIIKFIVLSLVGIYLFISLGNNIILRFKDLPKQIKDPTYNRNKYQALYFREIKSNPEILFFGLTKRASFGRFRIPHNVFFSIMIWGGIFYLIYFIRILYLIYKNNIYHKNKSPTFLFIYPFIGFVLPILFYPGVILGLFPLILALTEPNVSVNKKLKPLST